MRAHNIRYRRTMVSHRALRRNRDVRTPMLIFLKFIATFSAALFAGAALYINVAEHPARMTLDTRFAAAQWAPSYRRATWMQAPLALLSLVAGLGSWLLGGGLGWGIAAPLIGAVGSLAIICIIPSDKALHSPRPEP